LSDLVVATRDASYRVVPHKISIIDQDKLDKDFTKDELFVAPLLNAKWEIPWK
jgi:hypothetical protein